MIPPAEAPGELRLSLAASDAAFEGHFPDEPILPGVVLIDLVVGALRELHGADLWVTAIPSLRWRAVVRPGQALVVWLHRLEPDGRFRFEVRSGETLVSDGTLVTARTAP